MHLRVVSVVAALLAACTARAGWMTLSLEAGEGLCNTLWLVDEPGSSPGLDLWDAELPPASPAPELRIFTEIGEVELGRDARPDGSWRTLLIEASGWEDPPDLCLLSWETSDFPFLFDLCGPGFGPVLLEGTGEVPVPLCGERTCLTLTPVPEPSGLALLALGLAGALLRR